MLEYEVLAQRHLEGIEINFSKEEKLILLNFYSEQERFYIDRYDKLIEEYNDFIAKNEQKEIQERNLAIIEADAKIAFYSKMKREL